jgi:DNA-binding transcriptional regulator GbsR (MarR family)
MADQERDESEVERFVERFASELVEAGMPRMPARVFGALLVSETGALTSAELGERLRVSPAAVSGAVRYLAQVGMINREREPGSRRERYSMHTDQWYESFSRRDRIITRWENALRSGVEVVGAGTPAGERLAETADFFAFLQKELGQLIERWRETRRTGQTNTP